MVLPDPRHAMTTVPSSAQTTVVSCRTGTRLAVNFPAYNKPYMLPEPPVHTIAPNLLLMPNRIECADLIHVATLQTVHAIPTHMTNTRRTSMARTTLA